MAVRAEAELLICDAKGKSVFAAEKLDPAGYLLTMGGEVYVSPAKADKKDSVRLLKDDEAFFIPPGQFAFLLTEEVVKVPDDAFAFIALRSKSKFKGLVNVSGFHADPGFYGRLIFAVFNAGPGDVHLRRGDALFMVTFADLDEKTAKPRRDLKPQLNIPTDIILPIAGEIQSLAGLKANIDDVEREFDERLHAIERDVAILRWALALMLGAVVTLVVRMLIRP
ncbi:dCTP deaminase domain-containing protein [Sphingobium sp. 3R8]|uniref:dCTP deaminase domain-containing protein n=1 Tax=Sphingobium sp. 3R8 TaxID=2874921 RepID=UPI00398CF599